VTWQRLGLFQVDKDGQYSMTCTAYDKWPYRYAIGEGLGAANFSAKTFGLIAAPIGMACLGLEVRRGVHRGGGRAPQQAPQAAAGARRGAYGGYPPPPMHPAPPHPDYPRPPQQWR
jgi:hypothetical protein